MQFLTIMGLFHYGDLIINLDYDSEFVMRSQSHKKGMQLLNNTCDRNMMADVCHLMRKIVDTI